MGFSMLVLLPSTCSFLALSFRLSQYSCLYQQLAVVPIRSKTSSVYSTLIQFREVLHTGRVGTTNDKIRGKNRVWNQKQVEEEIPHQTTSSHTDLQIMGFTRTEETNIHSEAATVVFSTEIEEPILTTRAKRSRKSNQSTERTETAKRQTRKEKVPVEESNEGDTKVIIPPKKKQQRKVEATDKVMEDPLPTSTKRRNNNNNNNKVEQCITECDLLPKLWNPNSHTNQFKIISWNVNGIRAVLKKYPDALSDLANRHNPDLICIQETKLQESHVEDPKLKLKGFLLEQEGYDSYWSCSKTTLGYSGTAIFIKRNPTLNREATTITSIVTSDSGTQKKQQSKLQSFFKSKKVEDLENSTTTTSPPNTSKLDTNDTIYMPQNISFGMGSDGNDPEGRCIVTDYPMFSIINTYVPNAGDGLKRLEYRIQQWDVKLRNEMKKIEETRGVPVILVGDLNVAHKSLDVWNYGAKHLDKCAGTTPEERESFTETLNSNGFIDLFRHLHEEARGHYTFWSTRAGNRPSNKGMRLDYFVGSKTLVDGDNALQVIARDSYMLHDQPGSDHCPIVLELEVKKWHNK